MSQETTMIHVRLDETLKNKATAAFAKNGLTLSEGVRVLLSSVAKKGGLPPELILDQGSFDAYVREKVHEALADARPLMPHERAMQEINAVINSKRKNKKAAHA